MTTKPFTSEYLPSKQRTVHRMLVHETNRTADGWLQHFESTGTIDCSRDCNETNAGAELVKRCFVVVVQLKAKATE